MISEISRIFRILLNPIVHQMGTTTTSALFQIDNTKICVSVALCLLMIISNS